MPPRRHCFVCRSLTEEPESPIPGLKGEDASLVEATCSPACAGRARQFAARRSAELGPARAGTAVALLGVVTGAAFAWSGRDLGRPLVVLGLLGAGTTRIAYPQAVSPALARRIGLERAAVLRQWTGVLIGLAAVILGLVLLWL